MIHLIVGNTGAGKTTYALQLKDEINAVIFSIDQWNHTLFLMDKTENDGLPWFLERIERAETLMQDLIIQIHETGVDAILDVGLSKYAHREKFRIFAKKHSIPFKLHFLDFPSEIRRRRIIERNTNQGETFLFEVSQADFNFMEDWFEPPTPEELGGAIIKTEE